MGVITLCCPRFCWETSIRHGICTILPCALNAIAPLASVISDDGLRTCTECSPQCLGLTVVVTTHPASHLQFLLTESGTCVADVTTSLMSPVRGIRNESLNFLTQHPPPPPPFLPFWFHTTEFPHLSRTSLFNLHLHPTPSDSMA